MNVPTTRILAVDDSSVNLRLLETILSKGGYEVVTCGRGAEVLDLVLQTRPELILLDVMMPGVNGLEVLAELKGHTETADLPVLMVTARAQGEDVRDALEAGAFDYIKKPLNDIETVARVRSALRFKHSRDELLRRATHDSLTGLFNHGLLLELLGRELAAARRREQPVCYCMVDIDRFKSLNDEFGHQAGDEVLRQVSRVLERGLRRSDPVGRYGGEEFGIVLPGCGGETARQLCERLRRSVEDHTFESGGRELRVTVSLGLASNEDDPLLSGEDLVARADRALYEAKEAGRNRLVSDLPK